MTYKQPRAKKEHFIKEPYGLPFELSEKGKFSMPLKPLSEIKSKGEAETMAIEYQKWASDENLSYSELIEYQNYFEKLGKKFKLTEEFKENGII